MTIGYIKNAILPFWARLFSTILALLVDLVCNLHHYPQEEAMAMYAFEVTVKTQYLEEQSDPANLRYVFAYTITIVNSGEAPAQLIARYWTITDGNNHIEEVKGLGVVGHQPLLAPGEKFEYSSGAVLQTQHGTMHGKYLCVSEDGEQFYATIPEFVLSLPRTLH
jgi:ApaG protein